MSTVEQIKAPVRTAPGEGNVVTRWINNGRNFFIEVRNEMRRVTWPSRKEVYATTFVVLVTTWFFAIYLWGVDLVVSRAMQWLYRAVGVA